MLIIGLLRDLSRLLLSSRNTMLRRRPKKTSRTQQLRRTGLSKMLRTRIRTCPVPA